MKKVEIRSERFFWKALGDYSKKDWLADRRRKDPDFKPDERTGLMRFGDFVHRSDVSEQLGRIYRTNPAFRLKIQRIEEILLACSSGL